MTRLLPAVALSLLLVPTTALAEWPHRLTFSCNAPGSTRVFDPAQCDDQSERQKAVNEIIWLLEEAATLLSRSGAPPPDIPLVPKRGGQAHYIELVDDRAAAREPLGPNTFVSSEIDTINHGLFPPGASILGSDQALSLLPVFMWRNSSINMASGDWTQPCGQWLRGGLSWAFGMIAAEGSDGTDAADRLARMGEPFHPYMDLPLHAPWDYEGAGESDPGCSMERQLSLADAAPGTAGMRAQAMSNGLFFERLTGEIFGMAGNPVGEVGGLVVLAEFIPAEINSAASREETVALFNENLQHLVKGGLHKAYPKVAAGFTQLQGGSMPDRRFFSRETEVEAVLERAVESEVVTVQPLATELFMVDVPAAPGSLVRLEIEAEPLEGDAHRDVHLLIGGKPRRDSWDLPRHVDLRDDLDTPGVIPVAVAVAPEAMEDLVPRDVRLKVSATLVGECTPRLMTEMTNPRVFETIDAFANAFGGDGSGEPTDSREAIQALMGGLSGVGQPDSAVTTGQLSVTIGGLRAAGPACTDPLSAAPEGQDPAEGDVVISFYTPTPGAALSAFDTMAVAHDGWEGWPANAQAQVHVRLPGISVEDLEEGRSYGARLLGLQNEGWFPVYSRYEGRFHPYIPYQEAFTGESRTVMPGLVSGTVWIDEIGGGIVAGRVLLSGEAKVTDIEHTMREGADQPIFEYQGETRAEPIMIEGEFRVPARGKGSRIRAGAHLVSARLPGPEDNAPGGATE